jgi:hypothetical protein
MSNYDVGLNSKGAFEPDPVVCIQPHTAAGGISLQMPPDQATLLQRNFAAVCGLRDTAYIMGGKASTDFFYSCDSQGSQVLT